MGGNWVLVKTVKILKEISYLRAIGLTVKTKANQTIFETFTRGLQDTNNYV